MLRELQFILEIESSGKVRMSGMSTGIARAVIQQLIKSRETVTEAANFMQERTGGISLYVDDMSPLTGGRCGRPRRRMSQSCP